MSAANLPLERDGWLPKSTAIQKAEMWAFRMPHWWLVNGAAHWCDIDQANTIGRRESVDSGERSTVKRLDAVRGRHRMPGAPQRRRR